MKSARLFAISLLMLNLTQVSHALTFQSSVRNTPLLEIFSSEGCSSCPPAEKWLNRLQTSPALWKDVVPVCFHVDYWDYLGWTDILGFSKFSARQRAYGELGNVSSVYTPGFVLNGQEWKGWFNGKSLPTPANENVGVLSLTQESPGKFIVTFAPTKPSGPYEINTALLGMSMVSSIHAGENSGLTLEHNFAALSHEVSPLKEKTKGHFEATITVPSASKLSPKKLALAAWVTHPNDPTPLQSVGGLLPK